MIKKTLPLEAAAAALAALPTAAGAHRNICHTHHACPSDHATYRCNGQLWISRVSVEDRRSFNRRVSYRLCVEVIGNPAVATFAAFGSFAMLLLVDFAGPMRARLQAQAALAVTGAVFVCARTLASARDPVRGAAIAGCRALAATTYAAKTARPPPPPCE